MQKQIANLISHFGSQMKTAKALGVSQATVSYWLSGYQTISAEKAVRAEIQSRGAIQARDLCALFIEAEESRKMSESSPTTGSISSGPNGSVCPSSTQQAAP